MRIGMKGFILPIVLAGFFGGNLATAHPLLLGEGYDVHTSSHLASKGDIYSPEKLIAPSLSTAWCEGVDGDGAGEWIELSLKEPLTSDGGFKLEILPGYAVSQSTFKKNNRPKTLAVRINDSPSEKLITLEDYGKIQSFFFEWPGKPIKKIRLTIRSVYKGSHYADTCITDVAVLQQVPKHYWDQLGEMLRTKRVPDGFVELHWADRDGDMVRQINAIKPNRDLLSLAMGLSEGMYYDGDGEETLNELYLESLMHDPELFLWVLDRQNDSVLKTVTQAIVSPVNDKYPETKIRQAIVKGLEHRDVEATDRLTPLLDAYSIRTH
jgi:hypothetical protein